MNYNYFDTERKFPFCDECYHYCGIIICRTEGCTNFCKRNLNKHKKLWITIQDFKRRPQDLQKLETFIRRIDYLIKEGDYCIESGSVEPPNSNLHIHMLVKYKDVRHAKQKVNIEWQKLFPDSSLYDFDSNKRPVYKTMQHRESPKMPSYEQWLEEKLEYFENEAKGAHSNSVDLGCRGRFSGGHPPG